MSDTQKCIDVCNRLLRGEISAIETYFLALDVFQDEPSQALLQQILDDHELSVIDLEEHIISMDGAPESESGVWGDFAKNLETGAKLLGASPALAILRTGEEHGIREYEDALEDPAVMDEIKSAIRVELIPRLRQHIKMLNGVNGA
jgi:hypothetical protein